MIKIARGELEDFQCVRFKSLKLVADDVVCYEFVDFSVQQQSSCHESCALKSELSHLFHEHVPHEIIYTLTTRISISFLRNLPPATQTVKRRDPILIPRQLSTAKDWWMFAWKIVCACCVLRWIKTLERERLMKARWNLSRSIYRRQMWDSLKCRKNRKHLKQFEKEKKSANSTLATINLNFIWIRKIMKRNHVCSKKIVEST